MTIAELKTRATKLLKLLKLINSEIESVEKKEQQHPSSQLIISHDMKEKLGVMKVEVGAFIKSVDRCLNILIPLFKCLSFEERVNLLLNSEKQSQLMIELTEVLNQYLKNSGHTFSIQQTTIQHGNETDGYRQTTQYYLKDIEENTPFKELFDELVSHMNHYVDKGDFNTLSQSFHDALTKPEFKQMKSLCAQIYDLFIGFARACLYPLDKVYSMCYSQPTMADTYTPLARFFGKEHIFEYSDNGLEALDKDCSTLFTSQSFV